PYRLAGFCIEGLQTAVVDGQIDLTVVESQPAVHNPATHFVAGGFAIDFRLPTPFLFAGARVHRELDAPVGDAKDGVVPDERRGFLIASAIAGFIGPSQTETFHVGRVD